jgi:hypothetical protein
LRHHVWFAEDGQPTTHWSGRPRKEPNPR